MTTDTSTTDTVSFIQGLRVDFVYGRTLTFDQLPKNSIALDGAVQGPFVDAAARRFSFDHHAGCVRMLTLATCQQVLTAIQLGLVVDANTTVFVNDIDGDTVLSTWLLVHALQAGNGDVLARVRLADRMVQDLVDQIGRVDAHGPVFPVHPLHGELSLPYGDKTPQTAELLAAYVARIDAYREGPYEPNAKVREPRTGRGYAIRQNGQWEAVVTQDGFGPLYAAGYLAAALVTEANEGTLTWTIGKRSDLVPLNLGAMLQELRQAEGLTAGTWGGGSSIMGSPRLPGGVSSRIPEERVVEILRTFQIG